MLVEPTDNVDELEFVYGNFNFLHHTPELFNFYTKQIILSLFSLKKASNNFKLKYIKLNNLNFKICAEFLSRKLELKDL